MHNFYCEALASKTAEEEEKRKKFRVAFSAL